MNIDLLKKKKLGITILGGGTRSVAYAGLLKALEENDIKLNSIIGSSGGAVVGASYAFGRTPEEILHHFEVFKPLEPFNPIRLIIRRGIDYTQWEEHASKLIPKDKQIQDASIKLLIRAVNLDTNNSEYIAQGSVVKAIIASSAILQGYEYDGHKYIDGDYDPETGVEYHKKLGSEIIILCYIKSKDDPSPVKLSITQENALNSDIELHKPDITIEIPVESEFILSKKHISKNYLSGYNEMNKFLRSMEKS